MFVWLWEKLDKKVFFTWLALGNKTTWLSSGKDVEQLASFQKH